MRVLLVTDIFPHYGRPYKGRWMLDFAQSLSQRAEVHVLSPRYKGFRPPPGSFLDCYRDQPSYERLGNVHAHYPTTFATDFGFYMIAQALSMCWSFLPVARKLHLKNRFDVVHGQSIIPGGIVAGWIAHKLGLPLVVTSQGSDVNVFSPVRHLRPFVSATYRRAEQVTAVSQELVDKLHQAGVRNLTWVPNGSRMGEAPSGERIKGRILFAGTLWPAKGPEVLIQAFVDVLRDVPNATLDIAGQGSHEGALRTQADTLGLSQKVRFLGAVPHDQLLSLMSTSELFCLPSRGEGWPLVLVEALSSGCPVVSTDIGGVRELIKREELGFLVPPGEVASLSAALVEGLRTDWNREALRAESQKYAWDRVVREYVDVYKAAIESRRGRR